MKIKGTHSAGNFTRLPKIKEYHDSIAKTNKQKSLPAPHTSRINICVTQTKSTAWALK